MNDDRLKLIEEMLNENPNDPFLHYAAALEYKKRNAFDQSLALLTDLLEKHPTYLATYYQLGKLHEQSGAFLQAIEIYKKGIPVAKTQSDHKTLAELNEALMILEDEIED